MKKLFLLFLIGNISFGQITLQGLSGYYSATALASSGSSGIISNTDIDQINPSGIALLSPQIHISIIKYPADIYAQKVAYVNSISKATYGVVLRRINYGTFDSINDDGITDGTHSASDTWLNTSYAVKNGNLSIGLSSGLFISNLESYNSTAFIMSIGGRYDLSDVDMQIGLSWSNFGLYLSRYTKFREKLPQRITISANKGLKYLPLNINVDIKYAPKSQEIFARIGGVAQLPYNFKLIFGVNSDNKDQNTEYQNVKSLFGSTGIGVSYTYDKYSISIGGYSYGLGGWIYGTSFNYLINHRHN